MPACAPFRASKLLHELIKDEKDTPFLTFERKELISKTIFILEYVSLNSVEAMLNYLKGGKLIKELNLNGAIFYKIEIKSAQIFIEKYAYSVEVSKDKKVLK